MTGLTCQDSGKRTGNNTGKLDTAKPGPMPMLHQVTVNGTRSQALHSDFKVKITEYARCGYSPSIQDTVSVVAFTVDSQ